ncbi:unnamed protein product [Linum trigynum]|uniref:Transmembrane protein n=1 Tax=Linum trigynum TaxID=586398 RepID=A0AAV2GML8_9ROSI
MWGEGSQLQSNKKAMTIQLPRLCYCYIVVYLFLFFAVINTFCFSVSTVAASVAVAVAGGGIYSAKCACRRSYARRRRPSVGSTPRPSILNLMSSLVSPISPPSNNGGIATINLQVQRHEEIERSSLAYVLHTCVINFSTHEV